MADLGFWTLVANFRIWTLEADLGFCIRTGGFGQWRFWTAVANLLFWTQVTDFEFWAQVAGFWILNTGDRYIIMGAILHTTGGLIIMDTSGRLWILETSSQVIILDTSDRF